MSSTNFRFACTKTNEQKTEFAIRTNNLAATSNHRKNSVILFMGTLQPQLMGKDDNLFSDCYDEKFILFRKVELTRFVFALCVSV